MINVIAIGPGGVVDTKEIELVYVPPERRVADTLSGNITWTSQPSPYIVSRTVVVAPGSTLTIEPGTEVLLGSGQSIIVEGELIANGTEESPIVFTRYRDEESWGSLAFDSASPSQLSHCVVEYSSSAGSQGGEDYIGALAIVGSDVQVVGCIFQRLPDESLTAEGDAIELSAGAFAQISDCQFVSIGSGVRANDSSVVVENCLFTDLRGASNDGVDINREAGPTSVVRNSIFVNLGDDGIDMDGSSPLITANRIYSCVDKGISVSTGSSPRIENNLLAGNGTGIAVMDGSTAIIVNNTIVGNVTGVECYEKTAGHGGGTATIVNSILWTSAAEVTLDALSSTQISYSLVAGASVWPGEGNTNADPLFVDAASDDFRLTKLSPCIDAGRIADAPAQDMLGNPRPQGGGFDMGAYESPYWLSVDTDGDNLPDGWEEHHFTGLEQGADDDFDGDGMKNLAEYDIGANPTVPDTDGDGMPDGWEWQYGSSPVSAAGGDGPDADFDGDGKTNYDEYVAGTIPTDAQSIFKVQEVFSNGSRAGLRWHAAEGRTYRVLASDNLTYWREVATVGPGPEGAAEWFDNDSNGEFRQFYRLEVLL